MTLALESPPACLDSPLARLDPRWKLAAAVLALGCVAALHRIGPTTVALAGVSVLAALGRLPLRWTLVRVGAVVLVLLPFAVSLPLLLRGTDGYVGPLSLHGLHAAGVLLTKATTIVTLMLLLLATAPLDATLKAAHALYIPGRIVQLVLLTYRYIFVFSRELARLRVALRVRGFRNRANWHSYHTLGSVTGTLLVRGAGQAERVTQAMRCRGFDGRFRSLTTFQTKAGDVVAFLLVAGSAATLVIWDRFL